MSILSKPINLKLAGAAALFALAAGQPAMAQSKKEIADDAADVAMTPLEDVGIEKKEIAEILLAAAENPYAPAGNGRCSALIAEVAKLDTALGDDFDVAGKEKTGVSGKGVAKGLVGSIIPFRGLVREVSGAAGDKRKAEAAVRAGLARRSYLKGLGQGRGCRYPARPKQ